MEKVYMSRDVRQVNNCVDRDFFRVNMHMLSWPVAPCMRRET